ncbi:MAG: putative PEP-binding protein, partial [Elusimicrobiota bacterium]
DMMLNEEIEERDKDSLYNEMVEISILKEKFLSGKSASLVTFRNYFSSPYTHVTVINKPQKGIAAAITSFLSNQGFDIKGELYYSERIIGFDNNGLEITSYRVSRLENIESLDSPEKFTKISLDKEKHSHDKQMRVIDARFTKEKDKTEIDDAIRKKIDRGFKAQGEPDPVGSIAIGNIVKYDSQQSRGLHYPMTYDDDNVGENIKKLQDAVDTHKANYTDEIRQYIENSLLFAQKKAPETGLVPISLFLSSIAEKIGKLDQENREQMISGVESISQELYPAVSAGILKPESLTDPEKEIVKVFDDLQEEYSSKKEVGAAFEMIFEETKNKTVKILREENCSKEEAIFKAFQPVVIRIIETRKELYSELGSLAISVMKRLKDGGASVITLENAPEDKPFILLLNEDLKGVHEYNQLRKDYPNMVGIVVRTGTRHYAINARQEGFPVLTGITTEVEGLRVSTYEAVKDGVTAILDTEHGLLIVNPGMEDRSKAREKISIKKAIDEHCENKISEETVTIDGKNVPVALNLDSYSNAERVKSRHVDSIGLYRTEGEFADRKEIIDEEEWVKNFTYIVEESAVPVSVRAVDRQLSFEGGDVKDSPAFGSSKMDGLEFILRDAVGYDIALIQVKAAMRVFARYPGQIGIMFPMVSRSDELEDINKLISDARETLISEGKAGRKDLENFPVGIMFETLSALTERSALMEGSKFASIGTNDFISDLYSLKRGQSGTDRHMLTLTPNLALQLDALAETAHKNDVPISVCGMLASVPEFLLFAAYQASLGRKVKPSVGIGQAAYVKEFIRHVDSKRLKNLFNRESLKTYLKREDEFRKALSEEVYRVEQEIAESSKDSFNSGFADKFVLLSSVPMISFVLAQIGGFSIAASFLIASGVIAGLVFIPVLITLIFLLIKGLSGYAFKSPSAFETRDALEIFEQA